MAKVSSFTQDYAKKREEQVRENGYERFGTQTYGLRDLAAQVRPAASQRPVTAEASTEPARNQTVRPEFADQGISNSRGDTRILTGEPLNLTREGQWAAKHPIAGTLMYGVSNLVGGAEGFINTGEAALRALATGQKFNPNNIHAAPIAQGFRTGAAEGFRREAQEEHPRISSAIGIDSNDGRYTFGEKAMDFLTGVGADAVSSSISMATGGPLSTALMGGSAANQALYETSQDQNTTARQAAALATANGIAEAFFEHFSIERLMHFQNPTSTAQAVRTALAQAGVEASEEMATEIANTVSDIAIRRGNSERGREYQERLTNGEDPNSAARNTAISAVAQVLLSGLGGALSGGLHTGMAMYGNTLSNGMDLRRDIRNGITLEDIAGSIDTSTAEGQRVQNLANDIAQREASGTMASDTELGYLRNAIANAAEVAEQNEAKAVANQTAPVGDVVSETTSQESIPERQAVTQMMNDVASETAKDTGEAFRNANYYNSQRMTPGERIFNAEMSQDMASTFEEEGRKAFSALPAEEGVKAYREWAAHYNSMRLGIPVPQNIEHNLSPEQISAAMRAGALDLNRAYPQETMRTFSRTVDKIKVNGVNAGNADVSGIDVKNLTPQQRLRVDYGNAYVTKVLGMDVRWVQSEAVDGKYKGMNGSFQVVNGRPTMTLDVNAGMNRESDWTGDITDIKTMLPVISHETTHFLEQYNPKLYKELSNTVLAALQNSGSYSKGMTINSIIEAERQRLNDTIRDENGNPVQHSQEDAIHELVARACEDMPSGDKKALDAFNSLDANTKQTLWDHVKQVFDNIREFFAQMLSSYKSDSAEAKAIRQNMEEFEKIRDMWMNALDGSHAEDIGINIDTATESAAPTGPELSYRSWNASDWVQYKKEAAKELADALGVSTKTATKYINDVNSVAKMIFDDQVRLDYDSSEGRSAFVSNTEYGGSIDFSTLCKKRLLYTGTIQAIQNLLPNTALTPAEYLQIRQMMLDAGHEVTCGLCYVEGSRVKMGVYTKEFIEKYKKTNSEYVPTMAEMNTPDGQEKLRSEHPEVYDAYVYFMNHYGTLSKGEKALFASQQKPKLYTLRTEYKGEIKKKFGGAKNRASVADKNLNGGLRIQSFSDFEIVHMIDMMQVIMDMSEAGLAGQAYTKVPEFADSFGRTGLKINCSLITKGVDENGKLIFDDREGMKHERAFELRDKYSKNVGTVLVVFNQEQLRAALADDRIDYVLPFHKSQWTSEQYDAIGLPEGTIDFTNYQNDYIKGAKSKENVMPMEYWDFSKSGRENAERYLQICAEEGRTPKFARIRGENLLIDNGDGTWSLPDGPLGDGYFKLLIDFKMYDNNGKGARQMPVRPNFSMDEIRTALNDYKGGHRSFPVANDIVQEFVDNYKEQNPRAEYSTRDIEEAADSEDRPDVIRQGSDKDIQFSTRIADKNLDNRLRVNMATFFSGTGTVDFALRNIVRHEFAVENDAKIAAVYRANNGDNIYVDDVRNVNINPHKGKVEYFHASPVCKSYSNANNDMGEKPLDIETARATADAIRNLEPKVVTVENVARYRNSEAVKIIEEALEESGYDYDVKVYSATDFGGATIRKRMFIRAVKDGVLPKVDVSEQAQSWYSVVEDLIPELPEAKLSDYMEERLEPSGIDIDNLDQPVFVLGGEKSGKLTYATADKPAPTLLAKSTEAKILMPDGRVLRATPRVMARIQGLPDGFDLMEKEQGITNAYKVVGNGVPVQLTQGIVGPLLEENLIRQKSEATGVDYSQRDVDMSGTLDEFMERMDNRFLDRLADLDGEENAQLRQDLEDAYRANLEWTISEMQRRMDSAVGAEKKKAKKRLDALRARKNQRIDEVIAEFREKRFRERVKRSERKAQQELLRRARRLAKKKGDPNFRAQVDALIGDLDLVAAGIRSDTRSKLEEIKRQVEAQSELDPDYAKYEAPKYADLIGRPGKKHISQMKIEDIVQLTESIVALEHSKRTADREIKEGVGRTFGHYGKVAVEQQSRIKGINYKNEIGAQLGKYKLNMLNPVRAFSLIDGYQRDGVFTYFGKQLNDGQTKAAQFRMEVEKMFQDIDNNPKLVNDFAKQNIEIDTLEGKKKISKGMRIALYLHLQNADNVKHIAFGGITIPNERLYSRGKYAEAYAAGETVHLSEWISGAKGESVFSKINRKNDAAAAAAIRKITDQMTPEELEYAKIAEKFFNETTKNAINEVSLELNGYEKATVEHYFPISTNKNFLQSSYDGLVKDGTLEGMGMLKERKGSGLPIYLEDVSQVVLRQKNNTALYYGLAVPIRNFTRFYNYTGGERLERSVKASVGKAWNKPGLNYIDNVLNDLQFGRQTQRSVTDTMKSIYAGTTLNLNLGVAIKQSASYPFAASVIGWGPLAKAAGHVVSKADREYMDSITPWGYMRRTGFSGTEMGEVAKQRTGIDNNRLIQRTKTALDLIRRVDVKTTEVLFFACEEYVKEKYPDLKVRGDEYNRKLAEVYNETLQRTQPSYDVMQRNEFLRSQNDIAKIFGAFKTQTFNMGGEVIDAWSRWRAYSEYAKTDSSYKEAKREAAKAFGNTAAATIVAQGMLVILSAAANAVLHKMRDYRDEKGEITAESLAKKILKDFGTSFAGLTMGGSEAQDFALALLGDGKWYDIDYPGLTLVNDFASATVDFRKAASKAVETGNEQDMQKASAKMAKLIMQMFKLKGVPAQNLYNIVNAIYLWGTDYKNGQLGSFEAGQGLFGLQDTSPSKDQYAKQALDAYKNGDTKKGDRALEKAGESAIKKEIGGRQEEAAQFLKGSGFGDTVNRKLWEGAGWKLKNYDKNMK